MTQIYLAIYGNDSKSLILLIAWLPAAISVVFVYTIRNLKVVRQPNELTIFYHFLYVSIALALFLMVMTICQKLVTFPQAAYAGSVAVVCALLFVPLFIAIREELVLWKAQGKNPTSISTQIQSIAEPKHSEEPTVKPEEKKTSSSSCFAETFFNKPERGEDYTILQALLSTDMLILFLATFCGLGSSLTAVDNLGQIGEFGFTFIAVQKMLPPPQAHQCAQPWFLVIDGASKADAHKAGMAWICLANGGQRRAQAAETRPLSLLL
ncbi:hypothetical protein LOK49_LG15G01739 [Camellia lanceoleosa]|uniref:Uncharacterized protein n=1 Tax=Camellia lanceoleosa TaxID=1840588 RepID=A0ACC0F5H9_9ERIC|nr:hypothetical protein LOK49_LG15G01739 [Camellia lanceoleosa]